MKRNEYSANAKLRMVKAAEASGNVERWAKESRISPSLIWRWKKERDAGKLKHQMQPGERGLGPPGKPSRQLPGPIQVNGRDPIGLQVKILRALVDKAIEQGFDPLSALGFEQESPA